jgi:hypothetical protein
MKHCKWNVKFREELDHKRTCTLRMKWAVFRRTIITNMATVRNFEVISNKFIETVEIYLE